MLVKLSVRTNRRIEFVDITAELERVIQTSGIKEGICVVFVPHTTCGVTINEHADPSVVTDVSSRLSHLAPRDAAYSHLEGNADAHVKTSLVGVSQTVIVQGGRLLLGTWQGVFLCEFDGPRTRTVYVKLVGDR